MFVLLLNLAAACTLVSLKSLEVAPGLAGEGPGDAPAPQVSDNARRHPTSRGCWAIAGATSEKKDMFRRMLDAATAHCKCCWLIPSPAGRSFLSAHHRSLGSSAYVESAASAPPAALPPPQCSSLVLWALPAALEPWVRLVCRFRVSDPRMGLLGLRHRLLHRRLQSQGRSPWVAMERIAAVQSPDPAPIRPSSILRAQNTQAVR